MGLETFIGTYIDGLNPSNPVGASDLKSEGDNHIRGIKLVLQNQFPNLTAAVTSSQTELNYLDGSTPGTAVASKALVVDANKDIALGVGDLSATAISATGALTGATIDGVIGSVTPAAGSFTTLTGTVVTASTTLGCASGTTINEFSIDGTLAGNSDDAVPTEKAVKTYVDGAASGITTYREATGQSITNGSINTFTHQLGAVPDVVTIQVVCTTNDGSFTAGDIVDLSAGTNKARAANDYGITIEKTSTSIIVQVADGGITVHSTSGANQGQWQVLDANDWEMYANALYFGASPDYT